MKILHEKSSCCRERIYRFGNRRRQCSWCGKTWSVWKKRRGRKRCRPSKNLLQKIFVEGQRMRWRRNKKHFHSVNALEKQVRKLTARFIDKPRTEKFLCHRYILLIDGLWFKFNKTRFTLYVMAVRSVTSTCAIFLDPMLLHGKEAYSDWKHVVETIPPSLKKRIKALVSDGFKGSKKLAKDNKWILQRCHFHFIAQLQVRRGMWKQMEDRDIREYIYQTARHLLITKNNVQVIEKQLYLAITNPHCPRKLQSIIKEFLKNLDSFRTYLQHPELHLPTTTNTIESMNKLIRKQCRCLKTPQSLQRWATAFIRMRPTITCNGHIFQHN